MDPGIYDSFKSNDNTLMGCPPVHYQEYSNNINLALTKYLERISREDTLEQLKKGFGNWTTSYNPRNYIKKHDK